MITEIRLVSNDAESTASFWAAILNTPAEDLGPDRWGTRRWIVAPVAGPVVTVTTTPVVQAITRVDLTVKVDAGAADRLRDLGFEVAHDGRQAVDVNGTDSTVHLVVAP